MARAPRYDVPKAAPGPLRVVQKFVNTVDLEHEREWLGSPDELRAWLKQHGLPTRGRLTEQDLRHAHELREGLRALLVANNRGSFDPGAVETINSALRRARLTVQLDAEGVARLVPLAAGVDGALGRVLAIALDAVEEGSWRRLKACRQCRWAFFDYSKNRAATWCSMSICGNRRKTRAYRRRRSGA